MQILYGQAGCGPVGRLTTFQGRPRGFRPVLPNVLNEIAMFLSLPRLTTATAAGLLVLALAPSAFAQDGEDDGFHPLVGVAGLYRPQFRGSDDYEFQPLPFIGFQYELGGRTLSMEGLDLKLDLLSGDRFQAGPILGWRSGRDDDIDNAVVRLLPSIDGTVEGGVFANIGWNVGSGRIGAGAKVLADLGGVDGGYTVTADLSWAAPVSDRLSYSVGANIVWADEDYMQTYYGVTAVGAAASGLAAYRADSGVESVGLSASARYQLNARWGIALLASYDRLLDQAADTPIVTQEGSENQARVGFAVYRAF
ncbi:MipA/OmpV family protein [Brevundimonas sp. M20]|nr:MipA/OmpV family protein [Brevundimonas sp. M20]